MLKIECRHGVRRPSAFSGLDGMAAGLKAAKKHPDICSLFQWITMNGLPRAMDHLR